MTIHSVLIQKLLSTNAHLGRRVAAHHFKIYTHGARNAITIIDSDKTLICLRNACQFIANLVRLKGKFLFVNTNSLCDEIVEQMTRKIGCGADSSWRLGGFLTNSGSPKKFRSRNKKLHLGSTQPPDCVVIMDTERKSSVIYEADKLQIPIVGLVNSNMPWDVYKRITYPVPANDSVKFVYLFCNLITKTFLVEQKRLAAAMGTAAVREEEVSSKQLSSTRTETGVEAENSKQSKTNGVNNDNFVIPYRSLASVSVDPIETKNLLDKLAVVKLNEALGTQMGFNGPRSFIEVCNGLTYLDLIISQIESLNSKHGCNVPLILMNTIRTHDGTLKVMEKYSQKNVDVHTLCQRRSSPATEGDDTEDELDPFDHLEELFLSLKSSGTLDALILQGKEYILVVKYDNLGALIDSKILNHLVKNRIQYCTEYVEKLKPVDTGNLWINLKAVKRLVETDALDVEDHPVSRSFDRVAGVQVPQSRFQPMMATSDLFLVQSDLYTYDEGILTRNTARTNPFNPYIELGPEFTKLSDFQSRFKSIPSIIELDSLKVIGDVWFGNGITLKGKVTITAKPGIKLEIPDGVVLENKDITDPTDV